MTISNKTFSNREPSQSRKGWYTSYTYRICPDCHHTIISPAGQEWACSWCERHPLEIPDPRIARRESILAAFQEEPLNKTESIALYVELAEIDQSLLFNPSEAMDTFPF